METFTGPRELVDNPGFREQRARALSLLTDDMIDPPILDVVRAVNSLSFCFTMQSCFGHFVPEGRPDEESFDRLPQERIEGPIRYRIAYLAFCVENSLPGWNFLKMMQALALRDPANIQFGSADWFWKDQVDSYAVQVEPERFSRQDTAVLDFEEAMVIEKARDGFYGNLRTVLLDY